MTASAHRFQGALGVGIGALRPPIVIERDPQGAMGIAGDSLRLFERLFRPAARVELRRRADRGRRRFAGSPPWLWPAVGGDLRDIDVVDGDTLDFL
jgi:hypothetical protein